jgi:CRP-like cAMP-binding protein
MDAHKNLNETIHFLSRVDLFKDLSSEHLAELARASNLRSLPKGAVLFFQDDPAEAVYVVRSGSVMIILSNPDGRELVIGEARTGEAFGELALIAGGERSMNAVTNERCELLVIPGATFLKMMETEPVLMRCLLKITAERLYRSAEREAALAFLDAPARLARVLHQIDLQDPERGYLTVSQEELARRTGLTRQTVAKCLGRWRRQGWLLTGRGRVVLLDHAALEKIELQLPG